MKFYSTQNKSLKKSFRDATLIGLPSDNGLFMPEFIPNLTNLVKGINMPILDKYFLIEK